MAKISHATSLALMCGIADSWDCHTVSLGSCYDFAVWDCGGMIAFVRAEAKKYFLEYRLFRLLALKTWYSIKADFKRSQMLPPGSAPKGC